MYNMKLSAKSWKCSNIAIRLRRKIFMSKMNAHTNGVKMHIIKHMSTKNWNELTVWNGVAISYFCVSTIILLKWFQITAQFLQEDGIWFLEVFARYVWFHVIEMNFCPHMFTKILSCIIYVSSYTTSIKMIRVFVTIFVHSAFFLKRILEYMLQLLD